MRILAWLLLVLAIGGCQIDRTGVILNGKGSEFPQIIYWNKEMLILGDQGEWWLKEAKTRFTNPVIFVCHGGYEMWWNGSDWVETWIAYPDEPLRSRQPVQEIADTLVNLYPRRDIILVTCNRKGDLVSIGTLHTKRVWYVPDGVVWMEPDYRGFLATWYRRFYNGKGYGNIWDFVSYDGRMPPPATQPSTQPSTQPTSQPTQ